MQRRAWIVLAAFAGAGCNVLLGADYDKVLETNAPEPPAQAPGPEAGTPPPPPSGEDPDGATLCDGGACEPVTVTAVAVGTSHSCKLMSTGVVRCAGDNTKGQLGVANVTSSATAVEVTGLGGRVKAIAAKGDTTCAIDVSGALRCWGDNSQGQLGTGSTAATSNAPLGVGTGGWASIALGHRHACGVDTAGRVKCWGWNNHQQLGLDSEEPLRRAPTEVPGVKNAVMTAGGLGHTCALTTTGAQCWGANGGGQLGDGDFGPTEGSAQPVVGTAGPLVAIATGHDHTCGLLASGGVECWGVASKGELGRGATSTDIFPAPAPVVSLPSDVSAIAAASATTCALTRSGSVYCWGDNTYGQLGTAAGDPSATPIHAHGPVPKAIALAVGEHHVCVATIDGVRCWGRNDKGQRGIAQ